MQDTDYIKLVLKYLDSEASPAEQAALQLWLEADPQHRLEYQALERIWRDSGKALNNRSFDVEGALEKVKERIMPVRTSAETPVRTSAPFTGYSGSPAAQPRLFPWKWALAAASVLLVIGSASWWFFSRQQTSLIQAATATLRVALPDGSLVHLRKGSVLSYSSGSFGKERVVDLSGEAFFEPVHNPSVPFRIRTTHAILQDIGTSFLVKETAAADELTVVTGKVKFTERADPSNNLILTPGHKALLSGHGFMTSGTEDLNVIAWTTGILDFKDQPLEEVAADIADYYQTPVVLSPTLSEKARAARVTARFDHQPLKEVLEEIQLMTGLSTRHEKDTFVFSQ
jgi:ferric-dicitrate binding protein FerR (iron transport regulator)